MTRSQKLRSSAVTDHTSTGSTSTRLLSAPAEWLRLALCSQRICAANWYPRVRPHSLAGRLALGFRPLRHDQAFQERKHGHLHWWIPANVYADEAFRGDGHKCMIERRRWNAIIWAMAITGIGFMAWAWRAA